MASSLIASTLLALGGEAAAIVADTEEKVVLRLASTQSGTSESHARLICQDSEGHVVKSMSVVGSGTEEIAIDQISGALTCTISCILGSCTVVLSRLAGTEKLGEGTATAALEDLSVTTAKIALLAVDSPQIAAGSIDVAHLSSAALATSTLATVIAAAAGVAVPVTQSGSVSITTAAAETNTMAIPTFIGQQISLNVDVYAVGDRVITVAAAINIAGNTIMTFGAAADHIVLTAVQVAGGLLWRVTHNEGVALS